MEVSEIVTDLLGRQELALILEEVNAKWQEEQKLRHAFWEGINADEKAEFIQGEPVYHSPVKLILSIAKRNIDFLMTIYNKEKKLGKILDEKVMVRFTRNDYEPDICFWLNDKSKNFTDDQTVFPIPDFIVEISSPSTVHRDRGIKFRDYELHKVKEYWIVDPENKVIEQYVLKEEKFVLEVKSSEGHLVSPVLTGFSFEIKDAFID